MNATVHAAIESRSAPYRAVGEILIAAAACTILWGWPEIVFPAQAKAALVFGFAMGVPTGAALWAAYSLIDGILTRAGRAREAMGASNVEAAARGEEKKLRVNRQTVSVPAGRT
jgi:hypothetical protein